MSREAVNRATRALLGVDWEELGVVEYEGKLYLPSQLRRRTAKGDTEDKPCMLTTVTKPHRVKSRKRARAWARDQELDPQLDKDMVDEWENYELLAFALRDPKEPFDQMFPKAADLWDHFDQMQLRELFARLDTFADMVDPRFGELSGEEQWAVIQRIARSGDITPLASMPGVEQASCIVSMARAAVRFRTSSSSEPSPSSSEAAP